MFKKILLFLLILGITYGCKRQILDPQNPQTNLPQKAQFDKVKGFYENGRYKNQPKHTSSNGNERTTAADSARFKDFEPQWDKTEVEFLPNNEKMLIIPVVRFLSVNYNKEIGFIRRLCIRVDENEDFLEANIVELIGNQTFLKNNHKSIFKNYKNTVITDFSGVIIIKELNADLVLAKEYNKGTFSKNAPLDMVSRLGEWVKCYREATVWIEYPCANHPDNNGSFCGIRGGYWQQMYVESMCWSGSGGGGGSSGSGSGGGGSSGGGGDGGIAGDGQEPQPCNRRDCPVDNGENTEPVPEVQVPDDIDDIYDTNNSTLAPKQKMKLDSLFKSLKRKSCLFGEMIAKMKQAGVKIKFNFDNT